MDDINPVKYVENKVHNVGGNVKKFYSDVIQDFIPPSPNPVKTEAKAEGPEGNVTISTPIDSVVITEKIFSDTVKKLSTMEPHVIDPMVNQMSNVSGENHIVDQFYTPKSVDRCEDSEFALSQGKPDSVTGANAVALEGSAAMSIHIDSVVTTEKVSSDTKLSHTEPYVIGPLVNQMGDGSSEHCMVDVLDPPKSVNASENSESVLPQGKMADALTNENSYLSNEVNAIEESECGLLEKTFPGEKEPFQVSPFNELNKAVVLAEVAPETSAHVLDFEMPQFCNVSNYSASDFGDSTALSEMTFSAISGENDAVDMEHVINSSSLVNGSVRFSGNSSEILSSEKVFCHNSDNGVGCVSDSPCKVLSSTPPSLVSTKIKAVEEQLVSSSSVLSLESLGEENCSNSKIVSQTESFGGEHSVPFEALIPSVEIGCLDDNTSDIAYSGMETIDLCDKVKREESCVFLDDSELYTISCRVQKLRSYKKRIQDMFTSKKRLAKEYEQLAIWYGDVDIDSSPHTPFDTQNLQTRHACDSEWELL
ncbi:hypothetical protein FNV43_RR16349 [Rhamnella rubrinervis]|uniref:Uncharacterized protein n=1 Tax=Rhamnella rubrinervis TaxID=2594499 RepID=A0A8K0MD52_9ROSA|nr:hypothetical protein FNV43_RR16349 [Rhamnella rubrinervis]